MVSLGTVFELLENDRRRYALYYLSERNEPVPVEELVEAIDDWEDDPNRGDDSSSPYEEIAIELTHVHLPRSAEVEFVQYDPERGLVQVQGSPRAFDALVTVARLIESPGQ